MHLWLSYLCIYTHVCISIYSQDHLTSERVAGLRIDILESLRLLNACISLTNCVLNALVACPICTNWSLSSHMRVSTFSSQPPALSPPSPPPWEVFASQEPSGSPSGNKVRQSSSQFSHYVSEYRNGGDDCIDE